MQGILAFPNHAILAVSYDHTEVELTELGVDGWDGAHNPRVVTTLAKGGWIDTLDLLFLGTGRGEQPRVEHLLSRPDLGRHAFVEHARRGHTENQVFGTPEHDNGDIVILSRGIGGLREISIRVEERHRGQGRGRRLLDAALASVPENELVCMCVAPYNLPAIQILQSAGLHHRGTVQLFSDRREHS